MALHKPLGINKGQSPLFVPLVTFVTHESNCPRGMSANGKRSSAVKIKSNIVKLFSLPPSAFGSHLIRLCLRSATLSRAKSRPWRLRSKQRLRALAPQGEGLVRHEREGKEKQCVNLGTLS